MTPAWRLLGLALMALVLSIIPLPVYLHGLRPAWVLLWTLIVQAFFPAHFHLLWVMLLGICLDVLSVAPMGEHGFALVMVTWALSGLMTRFVFYSTLQQMLIVGLAGLAYQSILSLADAAFGYPGSTLVIVTAPIVCMLFWPLCSVYALGNRYKRR